MKVGARYYDPKIGRWIQKDPILSGFNWWVYCENDPVNGVDPSGEVTDPLSYLGELFAQLAEYIPTPILVPVAIVLGAVIAYETIDTVHEFVNAFLNAVKRRILELIGLQQSNNETQYPTTCWGYCCCYYKQLCLEWKHVNYQYWLQYIYPWRPCPYLRRQWMWAR